MESIALVHAAVTWALVGLIWFVQVVHYPLYAHVGVDAFPVYEDRHVRRTTLVVGPLMLAELMTAIVLAISPPDGRTILAWAGLALVAVIWTSTAAIQVPCHRQLERGFDPAAGNRLVATNWIRTIAWSTRGVVALLLLA